MEKNNITPKIVEAGGQWLWKLYDENGSIVARGNAVDTREAAKREYALFCEENELPNAFADEVGPAGSADAPVNAPDELDGDKESGKGQVDPSAGAGGDHPDEEEPTLEDPEMPKTDDAPSEAKTEPEPSSETDAAGSQPADAPADAPKGAELGAGPELS